MDTDTSHEVVGSEDEVVAAWSARKVNELLETEVGTNCTDDQGNSSETKHLVEHGEDERAAFSGEQCKCEEQEDSAGGQVALEEEKDGNAEVKDEMETATTADADEGPGEEEEAGEETQGVKGVTVITHILCPDDPNPLADGESWFLVPPDWTMDKKGNKTTDLKPIDSKGRLVDKKGKPMDLVERGHGKTKQVYTYDVPELKNEETRDADDDNEDYAWKADPTLLDGQWQKRAMMMVKSMPRAPDEPDQPKKFGCFSFLKLR